MSFRKKATSALFGSLFVYAAQAQVVVNEPPVITRMMQMYLEVNQNKAAAQVFDGFRIQLIATTDRRKVEDVQNAFTSRYPSVYAAWSQAAPYYRVRVGGFTSRNEASKYLQNIKKDFPDAYIVSDKIRTSELTAQ